MNLRKAVYADLDRVCELYKSVIGLNGSVWDENYPTRAEAEFDLENDALYVFEDGGELIGACSSERESGFDYSDFTTPDDGTEIYIARIVIAPERQGKGLGAVMTKAFIEALAVEGVRSVRLFAAKANPAAVRTYRNIGFEFLGECFGFGHEYIAAEYVIRGEG